MQETRCADTDFPYEALRKSGYEAAHHGVDHRNGVAILSRTKLADVQRGFQGTNRAPFDEARLIAATCAGVRVVSVYVPNGRELDDPHYLFKLVWLERLRNEVDTGRPTVVGGDMNVALTDLDIYDPKRWRRKTHASLAEREAVRALLDEGLIDVTRRHRPGPSVYTWWNYRPGMFDTNRGLRIDLLLASADIADRTTAVTIDREARAAERPSDHAPVVMDLDLSSGATRRR